MNIMEIGTKIALGWKSRGAQPISTCLARTTHSQWSLIHPRQSPDDLIESWRRCHDPTRLSAEGSAKRRPSVMSKLPGTCRKMKTLLVPHSSYPYCAQSKEKKCSAIQESTSASLSGSPSKSKNQSTSSQRSRPFTASPRNTPPTSTTSGTSTTNAINL
jgi:hypothetical protein